MIRQAIHGQEIIHSTAPIAQQTAPIVTANIIRCIAPSIARYEFSLVTGFPSIPVKTNPAVSTANPVAARRRFSGGGNRLWSRL